MIALRSLSKSYGRNHVLKGIDLTIEKGEIHGIVGKNGSGKTTLFNCLVGIQTFEGNIETSFEGPLKNTIGYLPTNPPIISKITGEEYLRLLCSARKVGFNNDIDNIFELPLNRYIETYSTGMTKKLAFHGILLQKNEIFVLDEPFNGLDFQSCLLVIALLKKMKQAGKTVVLSSHIFSVLGDTCDYIHHLKDGLIANTVDESGFKQAEKSLYDELIGDKVDSFEIL